MINWITNKVKQKLLLGKHNPYVGLFKGWHSTKYTAVSPNGGYQLWIANGLHAFKDEDGGRRQLLKSASLRDKRLIWRALNHDLHQDNIDHLKETATDDVDFGGDQ